MGGSINTDFVRVMEFDLEANTIDGEFEFDLDPAGPRNVVLEYFYFVDGGGLQVDPSVGTVDIKVSSGADIFQTIQDNVFPAADARKADRIKPSGFGRADKVKVTLTGVVGAVGFRGLISLNAT